MALAHKTLQRIGNSTGLVLTTDLLRDAGLERDDEVLVHAEAGRIVITRLDPNFDDLVAAADRFVAAHPNAIRKLAE
jgi:antitoxin component of MazEF toxin-antitoxin module